MCGKQGLCNIHQIIREVAHQSIIAEFPRVATLFELKREAQGLLNVESA